MNQKLADTLNNWRTNRDEDSPTMSAIDQAEKLLARVDIEPMVMSSWDEGVWVELNSKSEIIIPSDGRQPYVVLWDEQKERCCILTLQAEVPV